LLEKYFFSSKKRNIIFDNRENREISKNTLNLGNAKNNFELLDL